MHVGSNVATEAFSPPPTGIVPNFVRGPCTLKLSFQVQAPRIQPPVIERPKSSGRPASRSPPPACSRKHFDSPLRPQQISTSKRVSHGLVYRPPKHRRAAAGQTIKSQRDVYTRRVGDENFRFSRARKPEKGKTSLRKEKKEKGKEGKKKEEENFGERDVYV